MQEPTESSVLGDFDDASFRYGEVVSRFYRSGNDFYVRTDGADGELADFRIAYTFGADPLQQYLVELPGGRLQALGVAWDSRPEAEGGQRWFHLYPEENIDHRDALHWTRRYQNWNRMCADCHSTNVERNYRAESSGYQTEWSEIDVSCEACHGPGSSHVHWAEEENPRRDSSDRGLVVQLGDTDGGVWETDVETGIAKRVPSRSSRSELETCAPCHSRRTNLSRDALPGESFLNHYQPVLLDEGLYYADGQMLDEVYVYASFIQSKMYREGVTCTDCHDPHSLSLRATGNAVCASCHLSQTFDTPQHHFHGAGSAGARCVSCHMPSKAYMGVDDRRDHSFRLPRPDLSDLLGSPNACIECHDNRSNEWAARTISEWYGPERTSHFGAALHAGRMGLSSAATLLEKLASAHEAPGIARATALDLLQRYPSPRSAQTMQRALADADPLVRLGALRATLSLEPPERHRLAFPLLDDDLLSVRVAAARALAAVPRDLMTTQQQDRVEAGIGEYAAAQLVNADWPESHMNLGVLYTERGEPDRAEASYREALRIDPAFDRAYVNLADLYRARGRDDEGERLLREGLKRAPESAALHHALGLLLVREKRMDEAIDFLRDSTEMDEEEPRYAYVYAVALQSIGDARTAIRVLENAQDRHPEHRELLFALVNLLGGVGDRTSALHYARKLESLAPEDPRFRELVHALESGR